MMTKPTDPREAARSFVLANLSSLAADLVHWRRKGKLPSGSGLYQVAEMLSAESMADDGMQQAEYLVVMLCLEGASEAQSARDSVVSRLEWASLTLRSVAGRGRDELGDGYTDVLQVLGAVNASLVVLGARPSTELESNRNDVDQRPSSGAEPASAAA